MNNFTFLPSYFEAVKDLPEPQKNKLLAAICEYGVTGQEPVLEGLEKSVFILVKPIIDKDVGFRQTCSDAGKTGGRGNKKGEQKNSKGDERINKGLEKGWQKVEKHEDENDDEIENDYNLAGSPPASNSSSPKPLADLLDDRLKAAITRFSTPKSEFYYPWQEKAARYAIKIGLDLTKTVNGSQIGGQWFSLFKRSNGNANGKLANLEGAYQHFVDNPKSFDDPSKFLIFCDIYHHGRESVLNKNKHEGRS